MIHTQQEIHAMAKALRAQGLTWGQTNFAVSLVRNAAAAERGRWRKTMRLVADRCDDIADHAESGTCHELRVLAVELRSEPINNQP